MRRLVSHLLLMVLVLPVVISCSDDERTTIMGTWVLSKIEETDCDDANDNDFEEYICDSQDCEMVTFRVDNTWTATIIEDGDAYSFGGTYFMPMSGDVIFLCIDTSEPCDGSSSNSAEISWKGNSFTIAQKNEDWGCEIRVTYVRK
jgi:hypothetical protein